MTHNKFVSDDNSRAVLTELQIQYNNQQSHISASLFRYYRTFILLLNITYNLSSQLIDGQ